jgi:hypothetical protein
LASLFLFAILHAMQLDYLVIGHLSRDLTPGGVTLGGSAAYGALTARALGQRVAILTSFPVSEFDLLAPLDGVLLNCVPAEEPTTFEIIYAPEGRTLRLKGRATSLRWEYLPGEWQQPGIVHYAPIADEIEASLIGRFPLALVGVTPQGWMRRWGSDGLIAPGVWQNAAGILTHTQAMVLSREDFGGDFDLMRGYAAQVAVVVVTQGPEPVIVFEGDARHEIPVPAVEVVNETGAGDIFAAAFFVHYKATGDALAAVRFAAFVASDSVTRAGINSIPDHTTIQQALSQL